jgi:hypothetical protein
MPRLDLPYDQWVELREVDGIPRKAAREFRSAFYRAAAPAVDAVDPNASEAERTAAASKALIHAGAFDGLEDMTEALVIAVVSSWSFGDVDQKTLDDLPDAAVQAIYERADKDGYLAKLMPDFGPSPDEDSPTTP